MSPPEVERIGLAKQTKPEAIDSSGAGSSADLPKVASGGQKRRVHPILLLVLLLALAGAALAFGDQLQRAQELEGRVAFLSGELERAQDELAAHEQQMQGVRSAVSDLTQRMSALQTLVNEPARPVDAP